MTTATRTRRPSHTSAAARREAAVAAKAALLADLDAYMEANGEDDEITARIDVWSELYSERNAQLIVMQAPTATELRGFKAWVERGRMVRKGEHGIRILAPAGRSDDTPATEDTPAKAGRQFFKLISVFDIAQTDPIVQS